MPSARELLEQADALMRRNRVGVIDTEIPELTEIVAMVAAAPAAPAAAATTAAATPAVLDDVPELTEAVEEIEIESIVELPEDLDESSGWLHHDHGELSVIGGGASSAAPGPSRTTDGGLAERVARSALAVVGKAVETTSAPPAIPPAVALTPVQAVPVPSAVVPAVAAKPVEVAPVPPTAPPAAGEVTAPADPGAPATDEWARWEVLADEIRMQVLQRIDIFTDTGLRDQLSAQLKPIVDRASAEMVSTINAHVGGLLRAYIAEAIEREIEKWRGQAR